ncbi:oxidoreductase [Rhodococcus koreensis]
MTNLLIDQKHPQYPHALSPWSLAGVEMRNRILMAAHGTNYQSAGAPSQRYIDYVAERARGGAGLIITEGTHVHPTSGGPYMIDMWRPSSAGPLEQLAGAVHAEGGRVVTQLMHTGRQHEPVMTGRPAVGPSPIKDPAHQFIPHELTRTEIHELVAAFANSAAVSARTGFDGVELHCGHGYLIEQFLSPFMNARSDEYGGSHENRLRFARDIVRAVLDEVGSQIIVGARVTAFESVPGGIDATEALDFTAALAAEGLHFVSVTAGQHASPLLVVPPAGIPTLPFIDDVARVRETVDCAVFASHRVRQISDAERVLADGIADMVNMTRAHIADPFIVSKTATGREDEVRACIGCVQGCRGQLMFGLPIGCLVNPRAGRESVYVDGPAQRSARVAVVGGGIAGMQFASTAAASGHTVTLYERSPKLGGMFRRSASLPDRAELSTFTEVLETELVKNKVEIRLEHAPTSEELKDYEHVIVATGGNRATPDQSEWPDATLRVLGLDDALDKGVRSGERVVILDRGDHHNTAILLALKFAEQGATAIDIVDPTGGAARKLDILNRQWMTRDFDKLGVRFASNARNVTITGDTVDMVHDGWPQSIHGVDVLVVLEPLRPTDRSTWPDDAVYLGDCDTPGLAVEIIHHAYASALELCGRPGIRPPATT